jgi:hypothetical protein
VSVVAQAAPCKPQSPGVVVLVVLVVHWVVLLRGLKSGESYGKELSREIFSSSKLRNHMTSFISKF